MQKEHRRPDDLEDPQKEHRRPDDLEDPQKEPRRPDELKDLVDLFNEMTDGRKRDYERSEREKPPPPAPPQEHSPQ